MSARNLASGFASAMQAGHVDLFPLIQVDFSSGAAYWSGLDYDVSWSGNTYIGMLGMLAIEAIQETSSTAEGLRVQISAVPNGNLALALAEPMQGRVITVRLAVIDGAGALQVDGTVWKGKLDYPEIADGTDTCVITLNAEHQMAAWDRARPVRLTDAAQQAMYPGDLGLQYVAQLAQAQLIWPGAAYWKA